MMAKKNNKKSTKTIQRHSKSHLVVKSTPSKIVGDPNMVHERVKPKSKDEAKEVNFSVHQNMKNSVDQNESSLEIPSENAYKVQTIGNVVKPNLTPVYQEEDSNGEIGDSIISYYPSISNAGIVLNIDTAQGTEVYNYHEDFCAWYGSCRCQKYLQKEDIVNFFLHKTQKLKQKNT